MRDVYFCALRNLLSTQRTFDERALEDKAERIFLNKTITETLTASSLPNPTWIAWSGQTALRAGTLTMRSPQEQESIRKLFAEKTLKILTEKEAP